MRALIFTVVDFPGIARLPRSLSLAGWQVAVMAPPGSYITRTRYAGRQYHFGELPLQRRLGLGVRIQQQVGSRVLSALVKAVRDQRPSLLIPGDEPSARFLHRVVHLSRQEGANVPSDVVSLIARSLGDPAHYTTLTNKRSTAELAARLGLRVPRQTRVNRVDDARAFAASVGWPVVLKQPVGYSGRGVFICHGEDELVAAYRRCTSPVGSHRRFENLYRSLIGDRLGLAWHPTDDAVDIQEYVAVRPAMYNLVATDGQTIAGFAERAERINPEPSGPSTVVRLIEHAEMRRTAETIAAHCRITGFAGFDFVLGDGDAAYLLECNPRPTPTVHLGSRFGVDLGRALLEQMSGGDVDRAFAPPCGDTVALFPQEWARDPHSAFLRSAHHDVPWDEPELLRAYIDGFGARAAGATRRQTGTIAGPPAVMQR